MSISIRLKGFLDENQIPYAILTHTTAYTAQGAAATMQISGKELAKTAVLWTGEEMILAVLPAPNHVRLAGRHAAFRFTFTTCLCTWMSRWPTPGRTATRFACGTTTLFVWQSPWS